MSQQTTKQKDLSAYVSELEKEIKKLKARKKYGLVWEDKPEQVVELCKDKLPVLTEVENKEIKTLKDKPVNIIIEGDNFHSLSALNYTHNKNIDLIYIDPPYNTGNKDFIYNDQFVDKEDTYRHSKWLAFMDKRLRLAKNLLKNTGVIFISIDDNEYSQLKILCDEIFNDTAYIGTLIWQRAKGGGNSKRVVRGHEYILCYSKNDNLTLTQKGDKAEEHIRKWKSGKAKDKYVYKDGKLFFVNDDFIRRVFGKYEKGTERRCEYENLLKFKGERVKKEIDKKIASGEYILKKVSNGQHYICRLEEVSDMRQVMYTIIQGFLSEVGKNDLAKLGLDKLFEYPKPVGLIKVLLDTILDNNAIVLDFMAGSGTTGQAVLELNKEDNGNRKFILCTNNENNIASNVCYPRIKKVISINKNANLKYFKTDFVEAKQTDKNKKKLVDKSTEMLCLKEDCFDVVKKGLNFKIFTNNQGKNLGIIYDDTGIDAFKKEVQKLNKKVNTYVFSLDESAREEEFEDIKKLVDLKPIPAVILNVYKRIFK